MRPSTGCELPNKRERKLLKVTNTSDAVASMERFKIKYIFFTVKVSYLQSTSGYKLANVYRNCTEQEGMMQTYYINRLKESEFNYFCNKFQDECTEENTDVLCF